MSTGMSAFSFKSFFVTVSDFPISHNLSGQNKEVGCRCLHCFKETNSQYLSDSQKNSVHGTLMIHSNKTPVLEYEG
jgi:hypothetical protein